MALFRRKKNQKQPKEVKQEQPKEAPKKEEAQEEEEKKVVNIYHVSQQKDENSEFYKQWRVRKQGSDKTIKYFQTQKEAIDYANDLAKSNDGSVQVHRVDGRVRKQ